MKLGIVGLPNVGKSTLFNSLTKAGAESANYPFCTIDPNVGVVMAHRSPYIIPLIWYNKCYYQYSAFGISDTLMMHILSVQKEQ